MVALVDAESNPKRRVLSEAWSLVPEGVSVLTATRLLGPADEIEDRIERVPSCEEPAPDCQPCATFHTCVREYTWYVREYSLYESIVEQESRAYIICIDKKGIIRSKREAMEFGPIW